MSTFTLRPKELLINNTMMVSKLFELERLLIQYLRKTLFASGLTRPDAYIYLELAMITAVEM